MDYGSRPLYFLNFTYIRTLENVDLCSFFFFFIVMLVSVVYTY